MKRFALIALLATAACGSVTENQASPEIVSAASNQKTRCAWITNQYAYYEYDETSATVPPSSIGQGSGVVTWTVTGEFKGSQFTASLASQYPKNVPWIFFTAENNETQDVCPDSENLNGAAVTFNLSHDVFTVTVSDSTTTQTYSVNRAVW